MAADFYAKKRVYITGITGFKGTWLAAALAARGATVAGLDLIQRDFYDSVNPDVPWHVCDVRDLSAVRKHLSDFSPQLLFHLAAQPIVSVGYADPIETFHTNVLGTVHVLDVARQLQELRSVVVVTSDKCYRNDSKASTAFREADALGGADPYSASKAAQEMVAQSYVTSFFAALQCGLATARAGNTIGGGDFSVDRLIPDIVRAAQAGSSVTLRNPQSVRPWQHVLDPVAGYLTLAEKLWHGTAGSAYNFGPDAADRVTVGDLAARLVAALDRGTRVEFAPGTFAETAILTLDSSKAIAELGWRPRLSTDAAIEQTAEWYATYLRGADVGRCTHAQIAQYFAC
jgi:CDP-glucose 4,6-dehydratase